jgi:hypothetical protein
MILGRESAKSSGNWHSRNRSAKRWRVQVACAVLQFTRAGADTFASMRTLGYRTHVLLAVAAAVGVIAALGRPWYAQAPVPVEQADPGVGTLQGPADGLRQGVERWITENSGTSGWDALGVWGTVLAGLAALTAVSALACMLPAVQGVAGGLLRYASLACVAVALWKVIDQPGANDALELRFGAFVAAGAAILALSSGGAVAAAPMRRQRPVARYTPPPPPPRYGTAGSSPPPPGS